MDIAILICCAVSVILLLILVMRKNSSGSDASDELKGIIDRQSSESQGRDKVILDQIVRQNDSLVNNLSVLGSSIRSGQDVQQEKISAILRDSRADMNLLRKENQQSIDKIYSIITEKMQTTLDDKLNLAFETVVKNMTQLGNNLGENQERQQKVISQKLTELGSEFEKIRRENLASLENIRNSNLENMEKMRRENQESLDKINNTVDAKLQKTLEDKISRSFEAVNKRLAEVYEGLGEMKNVAAGVSDLKNVLSNVKTRGIMGEIQLGAILEEILAPEQYGEQYPVKPNSSERVDFAVKMPGGESGETVLLPIDSKFPGDTYANLMAAYESGDAGELKNRRAALEAEIKRCGKSIHDKYINPPYTTDFAIMFLPFEGLYAEVVNMGMVEILQRDYKVNIAGPSTMAAMLNSLQMGFRTLAIQKKSGEVWKILEAAKKEFSTFENALTKTRERLRQADTELEKLIGTRTNAINRKLREVSTLDSSENSREILSIEENIE